MCSVALAASWQATQLFSREAWGVCFMPVAAASWQVRQAAVSTEGLGGPLLSWAARAPAPTARASTPVTRTRAIVVLIPDSRSVRAADGGHEGRPVRRGAVQGFPELFDEAAFEAMMSAQGEPARQSS